MSFLADDRNLFLKDRKQRRISSKRTTGTNIPSFPNKNHYRSQTPPRLEHSARALARAECALS